MRKNGTLFLATLAGLGLVGLVASRAHGSDWIQQNKWIVAGVYGTPGGCGPGNAFIQQSLMEDCDIDAIDPIAGDPVPNQANLKAGAWTNFTTWTSMKAKGVGASDLVNFNDAIFGSDPNQAYAVAVIYAKNKTDAPLDCIFCCSSDDAIGIVVNDTLIHNNNACRGDGGGCSDNPEGQLQPGVNKIAVAAYDDGGGFNFRLSLKRKADGSTIDDTEAPDVAFDIDPSGLFDQFAIKRTVAGINACGTDKVDVSLKSNGLYLGAPGDTLTITERVTGPMKVSGITAGGTFVSDGTSTSGCDLPSTPVGPFSTLDIGAPAVAGSTVPVDANTITVTGAGNDIWAGGDQCQFAYVVAQGDFSAKAHIVKRDYLPGPNPPSRWGKFGVMARQDCSPNSRYVFSMDASLDANGTDPDSTRMAARPTHGGADNYETGYGQAGHHADYLRVDRIGNQMYCYASPDGIDWVLLGQQHWNNFPSSCLVGVAVTSHNGAAPIAITFDQLTLTGGTVPTPADTLQSGTITWSTKVSDLDTTGLAYTVTADTKNTDRYNFFTNMSGGDDKGHPTAGRGSVFFGHEFGPLGPDFTHTMDVGNEVYPQYLAGSNSYDGGSGIYTMRGNGGNVWADNDSFHWAYRYVKGDFDIIAEAVGDVPQPDGSPWGRYGLMARADCGNNARYTANVAHVGRVGATSHCAYDGGSCGFRFQSHVYYGNTYAGFDNQTDVRYPGGEPSKWQRMIKHNNVIYGYAADDEGQTWRPIGSMPFYGADPEVPIQVGFYVGREQGQIEPPVVKFKIHKFGPLDVGLPPIEDDGVQARSEYFSDPFDILDGVAWQAQHRDAAFNPIVVDGRLRIKDEAANGESTSCFSAFGIEDIDAAIFEFEYDAYMSYHNLDGNNHPADGICFVVSGEAAPETLGRVGFGGGSMAYNGLNRAFGALGGDTNIGNNSFAVEIDTWSGGGWGETEGVWQDSMKWHVAIDSANNVNSLVMAHDLKDEGGNTIPLPDVFDPNGIHMKVRYNRGKVSVWVGQNTAEGPPEVLTKALETNVIPISFGYSNPSATFGWTGANGGARETAEVDNFAAYSIDCNDIPDVAAISGKPAGAVNEGTEVTLGSDGSSPGAGDTGTLTYKWTTTGPGSIVGSDTGSTVKVKAGPGGGDLKVKLTVSDNDGCAANTTGTTEVTITVTGVTVANWVRGDTGDANLDITDAVNSLGFQFTGAAAPDCVDALDFNVDGRLDISDPVGLLGALFLGAPVGADFGKCEKFDGCPTKCP